VVECLWALDHAGFVFGVLRLQGYGNRSTTYEITTHGRDVARLIGS
jgi:hypothetical protein